MGESTIVDLEDRLLARHETESMVFEVNLDAVEVTDVTLRLHRDGEKVGSIYNDYGTAKTMARLTTPGDDFIGVEVPKSFVSQLLDLAEETGRVADGDPETYRLRMLD